MTDIERLLARHGTYGGHGIDHEDRPFHGALTIEPLPGGRGVSLRFRSVGIDGEDYRQEWTWVAPDVVRGVAAWQIDQRSRSVRHMRQRSGPSAEGADTTLMFGIGSPEDVDQHRVQVAFDLWPDGAVTVRHAAGSPGSPLTQRGGVRMVRTGDLD